MFKPASPMRYLLSVNNPQKSTKEKLGDVAVDGRLREERFPLKIFKDTRGKGPVFGSFLFVV